MSATCCRCGRITAAAVPVRDIVSPSGQALTLYACPDCAPHIASGPLAADLPPRRTGPNRPTPPRKGTLR